MKESYLPGPKLQLVSTATTLLKLEKNAKSLSLICVSLQKPCYPNMRFLIFASQVVELNGYFPATFVSSLERLQNSGSTGIEAWPRVQIRA